MVVLTLGAPDWRDTDGPPFHNFSSIAARFVSSDERVRLPTMLQSRIGGTDTDAGSSFLLDVPRVQVNGMIVHAAKIAHVSATPAWRCAVPACLLCDAATQVVRRNNSAHVGTCMILRTAPTWAAHSLVGWIRFALDLPRKLDFHDFPKCPGVNLIHLPKSCAGLAHTRAFVVATGLSGLVSLGRCMQDYVFDPWGKKGRSAGSCDGPVNPSCGMAQCSAV